MNQSNKFHLSAFADESSEIFSEQLDAVQRNGITHIELRMVEGKPVQKQSLAEIRAVKQAADDAGIRFSAVGSGLGKCLIDDPIEEQVAMCRHLVEAAHILETPYIRMFSFRIPKEHNPHDFRQQVIDGLGALINVVEGTGVLLAHENENGIYGETADRCRDLYDTFYSTGSFKGIFDFANFVQAGHNPLTDCWPVLKEYTEYFHIKDAIRESRKVVPPGQGDGHLVEILGEAIHHGLDTFLTLEPHVGADYGDTREARFDCAAAGLANVLAAITPG